LASQLREYALTLALHAVAGGAGLNVLLLARSNITTSSGNRRWRFFLYSWSGGLFSQCFLLTNTTQSSNMSRQVSNILVRQASCNWGHHRSITTSFLTGTIGAQVSRDLIGSLANQLREYALALSVQAVATGTGGLIEGGTPNSITGNAGNGFHQSCGIFHYRSGRSGFGGRWLRLGLSNNGSLDSLTHCGISFNGTEQRLHQVNNSNHQ